MSDTVNGSSCSYTTLNNYNSSTAGSLGSPAYSATTVKGYYVVPNYSAPGYNALTHGNDTPTCSGYFNVTSAYGANAANCNTQYSQMPCGNSMMKGNFALQNRMRGEPIPVLSDPIYPKKCNVMDTIKNKKCRKFIGNFFEECGKDHDFKFNKDGEVVCRPKKLKNML